MDRSTPTFFAYREMGCRFSRAFPIFDMLILSGDIRDQSRKLSKIVQYFGRYFCRHNFFGAGIVKLCQFYHPCLAGRRLKKVP